MFSTSDIDKLNDLKYKIINKEKGATEELLLLWETLPKPIWEYYNSTENGFDIETWTACLTILKRWQRFNQ